LHFAGSLGTAANPFAVGQIRAASKASQDLIFDGDAFLGSDPGAGTLPAVTSLGGRISLTASTILLDTSVALPAGTFEATARGGALQLGSHAAIAVNGRAVDFNDQVRFAPGGSIRLGASGPLEIASGAVLDASGSDRGGDAGSIELTAGGQASI